MGGRGIFFLQPTYLPSDVFQNSAYKKLSRKYKNRPWSVYIPPLSQNLFYYNIILPYSRENDNT